MTYRIDRFGFSAQCWQINNDLAAELRLLRSIVLLGYPLHAFATSAQDNDRWFVGYPFQDCADLRAHH